MFDFNNAAWARDTLRLSDTVSIRLWNSRPSPGTWQVFLYWQDAPGTPRQCIYKRFFQAPNIEKARAAVRPMITRWMRKHTAPPCDMYLETWNDVRSLFGMLPVMDYNGHTVPRDTGKEVMKDG